MTSKIEHVEKERKEKRLSIQKMNRRNNAERQNMERRWGAWVLNPAIFDPFRLRRRAAKSGHTIVIRLAEDMKSEEVKRRLDVAFGDLNGTSKKSV